MLRVATRGWHNLGITYNVSQGFGQNPAFLRGVIYNAILRDEISSAIRYDMNMKKKQPIPENLQKRLDELREKGRKQRAEFIRKFHERAEYSAEVDRQRQRDRRILIPWHYSNEFLTRLIVLCPHEINIAPHATYKGGGRKYTIELEKSGKVVRAKKSLSKGEVDPDMCKEIRDILSEYEEFDMGRAYAIVSNMCLDHVDEDTAIYTFAPEPMKKTIKI